MNSLHLYKKMLCYKSECLNRLNDYFYFLKMQKILKFLIKKILIFELTIVRIKLFTFFLQVFFYVL